MTTKPVAPPVIPIDQFPEFPPRDDMQNPVHLHYPGHMSALHRHFGSSPDTIVISEAPLGWNAGQARAGLRIPDLLVARNVDRSVVMTAQGYSIDYHGKPPDFVLEVASKTTSRNDETGKRRDYAAFGASEYWRFDDTDGEYYQAALAGDRLVNGVYEPIPVPEVSWAKYRGYSAALNLYVCWEYGYLRWYDPTAQRYLLTHDEEADARIAAEAAHIAAENELAAAEARIRQLESELRRRQDP